MSCVTGNLNMKKLLILTLTGTLAASAADRPNFLFIYTDDQRHDAMSVVQKEQGERARFPWFTTPNMDRLAAEGVRFRNAFVVCSLCAPSRAVNLTGRYNHENGIASNFRDFPVNSVTHATLLRDAGYTTAYIGKWHMGNQRARPGFDFSASYIGHAVYNNPTFVVDGQDVKKQGWIDDIATDYAIGFLRDQQGFTNAWSLVLGFKSPHGPFDPPARAKDRFADAMARVTPNFASPAPYNGATKLTKPAAEKVPAHLGYFRCISAVDDNLGRILDALDETGLASNTVVIYTSDNGFYLGEHGLGDKRSAYDESLRVPFLVRAPMLGDAARGRVVDAMVLNLDLAQTLLDFAGVAAPKEMQGLSWRPLLGANAPAWRTSWLYEYFAERQKNSRVPDITAVRTDTAKLVKYPGHDRWTELFDLASDPYETKNFINDPAHAQLRAKLEAELARLLVESRYKTPGFVDRPEDFNKPGWPDTKQQIISPVRLLLDFTKPEKGKLADASDYRNEIEPDGTKLVAGRDSNKALNFDGTAFIEVPKSDSLSPANTPWTVAAVVKPAKPDGFIVARGGPQAGYALWLKDGRPMFTVNGAGKSVTVAAKETVTDWTTLAGSITADRRAKLFVNGTLAAEAPLESFIKQDPNDSMQIGADLKSPVVADNAPRFTGLIESLRIAAE